MLINRDEKSSNLNDPLLDLAVTSDREALDESTFKRLIAVERKRTERSKSPFVLMLLETVNQQREDAAAKVLDRIAAALVTSCRDTDLVGWYRMHDTVGVMFTGLTSKDKNSIISAILNRVSESLRNELTFDQFSQVRITFHFFPDDWEDGGVERSSKSALYPDLVHHENSRKASLVIKRMIDVTFSGAVLLLCAPILAAIAIAVKLSSKGPVLFRQQRVGQYGKNFTFLKFRSMYANNDNSVHKAYVTKLISEEQSQGAQKLDGKKVFKLTNDSRVTKIGRFLRRTSLDELPQLFNVLKGDMSLVGPRPPIPYELAAYQTWHRRRVLQVKPGITGLWQVTGRSTVRFDDMVRLDLRYATSWSPWLDVKILLRTPLAVIRGSGAY